MHYRFVIYFVLSHWDPVLQSPLAAGCQQSWLGNGDMAAVKSPASLWDAARVLFILVGYYLMSSLWGCNGQVWHRGKRGKLSGQPFAETAVVCLHLGSGHGVGAKPFPLCMELPFILYLPSHAAVGLQSSWQRCSTSAAPKGWRTGNLINSLSFNTASHPNMPYRVTLVTYLSF